MAKKNVMIFPCGSEIGLELYRSLSLSTHYNIIGGSSVSDHGEYVYENYLSNLPNVDDRNFIERVNKVIKEQEVDFIFPAHDSVVLRLAQAQAHGELEGEVVTSPLSTCEVARSKAHTYSELKNTIPTPRVFANPQEVEDKDFPVFLKPDVGQGSKGTQTVHNREQLNFYLANNTDLLILEYLPGKEYTVDCFTDSKGELLFCEGRERARVSNGISVRSSVVENVRFRELAEKINTSLRFKGVWFFQVKESAHDELVLMEIAPRVAGTMGLSRARGVNLPLLSLFDADGLNISVSKNDYEVVIDRALQNSYKHNITYKHVYLDFDDLVIFENKVNPQVIAFVFQCLNKGIKIHLLTKHKHNLSETLEKYRLTNLFDEILWVQDETEKHRKITEKDAIFIDDSYAERRIIHETLDIPVFDAHMIECLMEKF